MPITLTSTTDSPEAVTAAMGDLAVTKVVDTPEVEAKDTEINSDLDVEADATDDDAPKTDEEPRPKKKGGFKRKLEKLTARVSKAEQESAYWREAALKGKPTDEPKTEPVAAKAAEGKPVAERFATHEDYVEALADWKVDQKLSARDAKARESEVKAGFQKQLDSYHAKIPDFVKIKPDFAEVLKSVDDINLSLAVQNAIIKTGPALAYELASDPEELERICTLNFEDAVMELGEIRARIRASSESPETPEPKTTKAPKPISPVGAKSTASVAKSIHDPTISQKEYDALRDKQEAKRRAY